MKPWLQGDFGELEPKKQMDSLRDLVQTAAHRGTDLHPFWLGLAHLDPIACAELAAGPKAVAHPAAVESALIIVETLERIIAPSGLYSRLLQLAPSCGPRLSEIAAGRHPSESWIWRLDVGPMRGAEILKAHNGTPFFEQSCRRAGLCESGRRWAAGRLQRRGHTHVGEACEEDGRDGRDTGGCEAAA